MNFKVSKIHLTAENFDESNYDSQTGNTDVIVFFDDGKKYIASFFAYENINLMQHQHRIDGNFHSGDYFWDKHMILVKDCSLASIEPVVMDLIDEGDFQEAFKEL